jgi:hypothetical protein
MSNIDYKAEVKAKFPEAKVHEDETGAFGIYVYDNGYKILSMNMMHEVGAWYMAYENLKKEGRIL